MIPGFLDGGLSYDPAVVVARTSEHLVPILGACGLSFVGAYFQYFGAIRGGFRDRTHSIPLIGNLWFFAHDTTFVVNFHHWFHEVDFWLVKAFWFALVVFAICETVVTIQILRFSRAELFPGMSAGQAVATYAGLQVMAYGVFWWFLSMIQDPFYYLSFATTVVLAPMFNIAMMRSRGSRRGFSQPMLVGYVFLAAGFWIWMFLSDPYFLQPFFLAIALGNVAMTVAGVAEFRRLKPYAP